MHNLELKARRHIDLESAEAIAMRLGAAEYAFASQEDTYFHCPFGRLKLRRQNGSHAGELISYIRQNYPEARLCQYQIVHIDNAEDLLSALEQTLGIRVIVRKNRAIYIWKNIRIHIDQVEDLGDFIEFEAVLADGSDMHEAKEDLEYLVRQYEIDEDEWISESYSEMLLVGRLQQQDTPV